MVTHTRNSCSAFNPSKAHTHTMNTHPEQWAVIYAVAPGEQLWVRWFSQGHLSRGIEGGVSAGYSLPHLQFLPVRDSNSQPLDYESDSLTISSRLPQIFIIHNTVLKLNEFPSSVKPKTRYFEECASHYFWCSNVQFVNPFFILEIIRVKCGSYKNLSYVFRRQ